MECPKCHKIISEKATMCPHCHKVLSLECPNCHNVCETPICDKCGYIILTKCAKCGRKVSTKYEKCKCGFPIKSSIAYQECETDEFASIIIRFSALKSIRRILGSQELFTKFYFRLRNLLVAQFKNVEGRIITYNDAFVVNYNKELSFPTSVNKAIRLAIKIANAFADLNLKVIKELGTSLKLSVMIVKKEAENLLEEVSTETNVKLLNTQKEENLYLKGMQIIFDQFVWDCLNKDFKTDSLFSVEKDGVSTMFYELLLPNYVLPPNENTSEEVLKVDSKEIIKKNEVVESDDIYGFKVFDINAKCKFFKIPTNKLIENLGENKIISIRSKREFGISTSEIFRFFEAKGKRILHVSCVEEMTYRPWGLLSEIFRDYYKLSVNKNFISPDCEVKRFKSLYDLVLDKTRKAATPEDARFAYMEDFGEFLSSLKDTVIFIENFENVDDTSIQTLELYFDKFKKVNADFIFTTDSETVLHSKINGLLRTSLYSEFILTKISMDSILSDIKQEAGDFIESFYFEKIKENFKGSLLYFENAIKFLIEKGVLIDFENRLIIKNKNSVILPKDLSGLLKARLKHLGKFMDASMILAYSVFLGSRLDFATLSKLGIKDVEKNVKLLEELGFIYVKESFLYINNYNLLKPILESSLKPPIIEFLSKNILANLAKGLDDTSTLFLMGKLSLFKEEYLLLWRNSQFAMKTGDYDAYLKNCLGFLSLIEHIKDNISTEEIEENKKEVYQNILMSLYSYSPEKIYSIEKFLLMDAIKDENNEQIVKLSNLMLQGALISSNYTDALSLLHNILTRMPNPKLLVDGVVNTKFLLLSLVNIEILFNIGDLSQCIEVAKDLLSILKPEIIEKIKPASFSMNLFVEHMFEIFRLVAFAKLFRQDDDLLEFFEIIHVSFGEDLPDKNAVLAIQEFLNGKHFAPSDVENATAFSKIIYLILQEYEEHSDDYKNFAQNIYQAKLLATETHQHQLELFCDLLIGYSYANIGILQKAEAIYNDIFIKADKSAIFNIKLLAQYFIARIRISQSKPEEALLIINDSLAFLQKNNNMILYVIFEKLFIDIVKTNGISSVNVESEEQKLAIATSDEKLSRLI